MWRFILLFPLLLVSCFESREEVSLNLDGSGSLELEVKLPALAKLEIGDPEPYLKVLREIDAEEDGIQFQTLSFDKIGGQLIFFLKADFEEVWELKELQKRHAHRFLELSGADPAKLGGAAGRTEVKMRGLGVDYERTIPLSGMLPTAVRAMPGLVGSAKSTFTINLPIAVKESNADKISKNGKSLTWNFLIRDHVQEPLVMKFRTTPPWWAWLLLGIFLFLLWKLARRVLWKK